jgi:hypothetical protein
VAAVNGLVLVEHPQHVLRGRHHVRRGHVHERADLARDLAHPATTDRLLLARAEVVRIADDASLAAAERNVDHRAFPGHPHRQRPHRVHGFLRVESNAALAGTARVVVLYPETAEHLHRAIVHADGNAEVVLAHGIAQHLPRRLVETELVRDLVELGLRHRECVVGLLGHVRLPPDTRRNDA